MKKVKEGSKGIKTTKDVKKVVERKKEVSEGRRKDGSK
jgi:hypothetical protein